MIDFSAKTSNFVREASDLWSRGNFVQLSRLLIENANHHGSEAKSNYETQIDIVRQELSEQIGRMLAILNQLAQPLGADPRTTEVSRSQLGELLKQFEAEKVLQRVPDLHQLVTDGEKQLGSAIQEVLNVSRTKHSSHLTKFKFVACCNVSRELISRSSLSSLY